VRSPAETSQSSCLVGTPPHTLLVHYPVALATVVPALDLMEPVGSDGDSGVIRTAAFAPWPATIAALAAFAVMSVGNFFGGELVYRLGMRVKTVERAEEMRRAS